MYNTLVGCANFLFIFGRFYVNFYMYTMGRYNYVQRKVHIAAMLRIFCYLNFHKKISIIPGNRLLEYREEVYLQINCSGLYPNALEDPTPGSIYPKIKSVGITTFFHSNNDHDIEIWQSFTLLLMNLNKTLIHWYRKRHNTLYTLTYGP